MSKQINAAKLKAMGIERVRAVCIKHATIAINASDSGDTRTKNLHCNLLDQCAQVARDLVGNGPLLETSHNLINVV